MELLNLALGAIITLTIVNTLMAVGSRTSLSELESKVDGNRRGLIELWQRVQMQMGIAIVNRHNLDSGNSDSGNSGDLSAFEELFRDDDE